MSCFAPSYGSTQKGIAEALSLAQSTVATALNPETAHKLQPETVARVHDYAKKVGYRPRRFAQIMRSGRSHIIGAVFVSGVYHAPQERVKLLARHAIEAAFNLIAVDLDWFGKNVKAAQEYLIDAAVEGVVLCNLQETLSGQWREFCEERGLPMVAMAGGLEGDKTNSVESDMETAFREMTAHHIAMGGKRLSLLLHVLPAEGDGVLGEKSSTRVRAYGFLKAIREAGGRVEMDATLERLIGNRWAGEGNSGGGITGKILYSLSNDFTTSSFEHGRQHMRRLVETGTVPDSLLCANDNIAVGALSYCHKVGIRVPEELRVSGADDAPFARYYGVPLTSIRQPSEEMAEWSVRRIIELIENPGERKTRKEELFPCELLLRGSTQGFDSEGGPER